MRKEGKEPRDRQLNLSLTTTEFAEIRRRADAAGKRPAEFGRAVLFQSDLQISLPSEESNGHLIRLHAQYIRLGNSLNQMMRKYHRSGHAPDERLAPLLDEIRKLIRRKPEDDR